MIIQRIPPFCREPLKVTRNYRSAIASLPPTADHICISLGDRFSAYDDTGETMRRSRVRQRVSEGIVIGLIVGVITFLFTACFELQRANNDQRIENLRFVRERSSDDPNLPRPFRGLDLERQNLSGLRLPGAQLVNANLNDADLKYAFLPAAGFNAAHLEGADLSDTTLHETKFIAAHLKSAKIVHAYAISASFKGSDLSGTDFSRSSLQGADFTDVKNLDSAALSDVCWDSSTIWPEGFTPPPSAEAVNCPS